MTSQISSALYCCHHSFCLSSSSFHCLHHTLHVRYDLLSSLYCLHCLHLCSLYCLSHRFHNIHNILLFFSYLICDCTFTWNRFRNRCLILSIRCRVRLGLSLVLGNCLNRLLGLHTLSRCLLLLISWRCLGRYLGHVNRLCCRL